VSISVILVNAITFIVIGILREDPLSTGMLDVLENNFPFQSFCTLHITRQVRNTSENLSPGPGRKKPLVSDLLLISH
jgi:hypothetical protein